MPCKKKGCQRMAKAATKIASMPHLIKLRCGILSNFLQIRCLQQVTRLVTGSLQPRALASCMGHICTDWMRNHRIIVSRISRGPIARAKCKPHKDTDAALWRKTVKDSRLHSLLSFLTLPDTGQLAALSLTFLSLLTEHHPTTFHAASSPRF